MNWQQKQVSFYSCPADNTGRAVQVKDILFAEFAIPHKWFRKNDSSNNWISGTSNDLETIARLRTNEITNEQKLKAKLSMQCWSPSALLECKKKGSVKLIEYTGLLQLDFDYKDIKDYDIDELKRAVFDLPFIAFCSVSCSGNGFFALAEIAEPEKLTHYAEHCFLVLDRLGISADTSKGKNINDLRFVSYDGSMLIRDTPKPLKIKRFAPAKKQPVKNSNYGKQIISSSKIVNNGLDLIRNAEVGNRFPTVQKVAYTFGGLSNNNGLLDLIIDTINNSSQFAGTETKYIECARVCFNDGCIKPLIKAA